MYLKNSSVCHTLALSCDSYDMVIIKMNNYKYYDNTKQSQQQNIDSDSDTLTT